MANNSQPVESFAPDLAACNQRFGKNGYVIEKRDGVQFVKATKPELMRAVFPVEARAEADGTVEISITSEYPVMRWGEKEIISHQDGDISVARLSEVGAILFNHDPNQIVGAPVRAWVDSATRKTKATVRFGTDEIGQRAMNQVLKDKTLRGVSGGFTVREWVYLKDENVSFKSFTGPAWIGVGAEIIEASLTPIPADPSVGVNRSEAIFQENKTMSDKNKEQAANEQARTAIPVVAPVAPPAPETRSGKDEIKAERARVREIELICRKAGISDEDRESYIASDKTPGEVRAIAFEKMSASAAPVGAQVVADGRDSVRAAAIDGMLLRAGQKVDKPSAGSDEFRGRSLLRIAEECLMRAGQKIPSDVRDIVKLAMRGAEMISGAASDFPFILANTANKSLLAGYATAETSFQHWASIGSLNDFKSATRIKFSEVGKLKAVPENGKYATTAMTEKRETIQLGTYARKFTISRQAVINDDLSAFTRIPMSFGMQARFLPNDLAIAVLTANAAMSDAVALFNTAHGNTSSETDRRLDTVAHAQAAAVYMYGLMAQQQTLNADAESDGKRYLNLKPKVWLVAGTDEIIARQAVVSAGDAASTVNAGGIINPINNLGLMVVSDQNIKTGATDYTHYMFADPRLAPVVEVAFLQGNQQPYFEQTEQTDADGTIYLVRLDCGAAAVDYVGAVREVGTD